MTFKNTAIERIPDNWTVYKLEDIATLINGRAYKNTEFKSEGTPIVRIQNLKGEDSGSIVYSDLELPDDKYIDKGDLIYAWSATFGPHIWKGPRSIYHYHIWKVICRDDLVDKYFLYYKLKYISDRISAQGTGSIFSHITKGLMESQEIGLPQLEYQKRCADILTSLDNKIDLNNRMNKVLEQMAQTIFKQWFVDFEFPNDNGDPYKSSGGAMKWCEELGTHIPRDWNLKVISDLIEINPKRTLKKGSVATYLEMKNLPAFSARATGWTKRELTSGSKFINGDVLMARITPCLENGKTVFVDFLNTDEVGWGSTEFIVLRSKNNISLEFAYFLARSEEFRNHAISNMSGSSGRQRVPESCFNFYHIAEPPTDILNKFGMIARNIMLRMKSNGEEVRILSVLRDTLLPKLMSGEIDVSEVEK